MQELLRSVIFGVLFIGTLVIAAPIFNEDKKEQTVTSLENQKLEQQRDILIPL